MPTLGALAAGLVALVPFLGVGMAIWGMPLGRPLGQPRTTDESPVTASNLGEQRTSSSPALAVDPTDDRFVALASRRDSPEPGCGLEVSGDGGASWVAAGAQPALPAPAERCWSPDVAFDAGGTLYLLFAGVAGDPPRPTGVYLATSRDRARTFAPARQVAGGRSYGARLGVDPSPLRPGRVHVTWLHAGDEPTATGFSSTANQIMAASSDDGGARFSEAVAVSGETGSRVAAPTVAVSPTTGRVHVAWYALGDDARDYEGLPGLAWEGRWSLWLASSRSASGRLVPGRVVDDDIVAPFRVASVLTMAPASLAAGDDRICLGWTDARNRDPDVLVRCSDANGWVPAQRVNDDPLGNGQWQYLPALAIAPNGRLDVAFYDRREYRRNHLATVGFSYSYDGRRFSGNVALAAEHFDPAIGTRTDNGGVDGRPVDAGSRLAVSSGRTDALAAWADTRNGSAGLAARDIYAGEASLLLATQRPFWAVPLGMALLVGGLAASAHIRRRARG